MELRGRRRLGIRGFLGKRTRGQQKERDKEAKSTKKLHNKVNYIVCRNFVLPGAESATA